MGNGYFLGGKINCLKFLTRVCFFVFIFAESPIRTHGGFCLQPASADCNPADNTRLVYSKDTPECSKDYMMFTYYKDVLTHKCSGKKVCPQGRFNLLVF